MRRRILASFLAGAATGAAGTYFISAALLGNWPFRSDKGVPAWLRPAEWGQPLELPGVPNLHRVSAALYRGGQPTAQGLRELGRMGVRTIVNLRSLHGDRDDIAGLDLEHVHIPMTPSQPKDQDVVGFLKVVTDPSRAAVFVHCQYGADRTGTMVAVYRIAVQGWDTEQAIREMTCGGYGFHEYWDNLVDYIRKLDVERIRRQAGLAGPASRAAGE